MMALESRAFDGRRLRFHFSPAPLFQLAQNQLNSVECCLYPTVVCFLMRVGHFILIQLDLRLFDLFDSPLTEIEAIILQS